jgi:hypothetical protein
VSDDKPDERPGTQTFVLKAEPGAFLLVGGPVALKAWKSYSFAPEWFADASREAGVEGLPGLERRGARRREILFAVCAAESYVFEWGRDTVLNHDFKKLKKYFPAGRKWGVLKKLEKIPTQLKEDGLVSGALDCHGQEWSAFQEVVAYRHGLVHAAASRPQTDDQPKNEKPVPAAEVLDAMMPGWAFGVVRVILRKLHTDTKTTPIPDWLS